MIFKRISYTLALQFMAFVFLLLVINGAIFLVADYGNERRQMTYRLTRTAYLVMQDTKIENGSFSVTLQPMLRERVRIVDSKGNIFYSGSIFEHIPFVPVEDVSVAHIDDEEYGIITMPMRQNGELMGYVQIAEVERFRAGDLPLRALLYLLISGAISVLTFFVGIIFARRSLKPAEQMVERLEQFTQDASHELRTPIATIHSSLDLALKSGKHKEGLMSAKEDLKELSQLVERLLELARLDNFVLQKTPVDLSLLVNDTVERLKPIAEHRHVTIETDIKEGVTARADGALIRQVVQNLLSNAIKFSKPEGGVIKVMLRPGQLTIEDTGIGINKDALQRIFDRFFQVDASRAKGGMGLGLALTKRILDLHRWRIAVRSKEGKGTVFIILIVS